MTDHGRFLDLAAASIDFELSHSEAAQLSAHLSTCASCRVVASGLRSDAQRLRDFAWHDAPDRVGHAVAGAAYGTAARPRRNPWILVAAAALLLAALAGGTLAVGAVVQQLERQFLSVQSPEPPATVVPATPSEAPRATASPTPTPEPSTNGSPRFALDLPWTLTRVSGSGIGSRMLDVAAMEAGFVAVGSDRSGDATVGAAWTSPDGIAWTERVLAQAPPLSRVAVGAAGLVAIGGDAVWTSVDGSAWTAAPGPPASGSVLVDVAASERVGGSGASGRPGFVAIGHATADAADAVAWTSGDGLRWTRVLSQAALAGFCPSAVAYGPSGFVAIGTDCGSDPVHAVVAVSSDGRSWSRAADQPVFAEQAAPAAVTAGGPGFIAGGYWREGERIRQAIWTSGDGSAWRRRASFGPPGASEAIRAITSFVTGFVAVGVRDPGTADAPTAWASPDGVAWTRAEPLPDPGYAGDGSQSVESAAALGDRIVVVGWYDSGPADGGPLTWAATLTQP